MNEQDFRSAYPEFDPVTYPSALVNSWLSIAAARLIPDLWQDTLTQGIGLFVAHFLAFNAQMSATGGKPIMLATAKGVDGVTVSYDPSWTMLNNAGFWNGTGYGQQFIWWARLVGKTASAQFGGSFQ